MEIIYLFSLMKKRKFLILITTLIFLLLGMFYYFQQGDSYEASLLFYVKRKIEPVSEKYYSYDGYYASQVSKEYSDTVIGFFQSLEVLKRAGEITNYIPRDVVALESLSSRLIVTKEAPQLIKASVTTKDKEESSAIIKAVGQAGIERILLLNQTGDPNLSLDVVDSEPLVLTKNISLFIFVGGGLLFGFIFGIILSLFLEVFKKA
ncbi:hypothetical protein A2X44_03435 [candidate division CPR3 bacterium GWF2_35_18]|uniref:Polysaccharide chain length determinant N-terminal domain-containing protein n=1 Tax=candidate division CPR3 bacterium GW2011_GWF2_35_18 TaxID=1618350 RepID=A0A0G0E2V4_UNCC3|nr:MAG: hypothetical protein UR67_C0005G0049 [candidate division CPR3 bacterium GW2011_GWF2_35_18]KKP86414.1 MAG: hypothetical protein UR87_C0020G0006 [candidate division CPR3 bacterium GW2011_GWE2_35_7]OGB63032.1 MAG: hypothetical protein A2X44_03435 [candidate division CPR3 bacterium GWF2_35_18]OGB63944.1 MAG: hypothetical protein A2250_02770 [candidate division CPR3 bacterium RIFOXYA2_FULL_35_13]OGB76106.1 MAG: hypothetical protein A2476_00110 [candidate division CPR3 bacterium RIFOXYC2_FULL